MQLTMTCELVLSQRTVKMLIKVYFSTIQYTVLCSPSGPPLFTKVLNFWYTLTASSVDSDDDLDYCAWGETIDKPSCSTQGLLN